MIDGVVLKPFVWNCVLDASSYLDKQVDSSFVLISPSENELREALRRKEEFCVLAPYFPPEEFSSFFVLNLVPPKSLFTVQETVFLSYLNGEERERKERELISRKLGITIHRPRLNLDDLKGARVLKEHIKQISASLKDKKLMPKGVFLIGIPGTGKSYSAKCVAGELGRWLIELNLSRLLERERPLETLHMIFSYIEKFPPSVIWIDEVDKVFTEGSNEKKLMGQMLTILEEFNTPSGYNADSFFWITANDVRDIVRKFPEFFRRFDYLFFVKNPRETEALEILDYYLREYDIAPDFGEKTREGNLLKMQSRITAFFRKEISRSSSVLASGRERRFVYTPAEIKNLVLKIARLLKTQEKRSFGEEELLTVLEKHVPIIFSFRDAIASMEEQENLFVVV